MVNSKALKPSFLRDAFVSYAKYNSPREQEVQKSALKWLQSHIESDLSEGKTIIKEFSNQWRKGSQGTTNAQESAIALENLPRSYKGSKAIDSHQEDALIFIHEAVTQDLKDDFEKRWNIKQKLRVTNSSGTTFMVNEEGIDTLREQDPEGNGITWYQVEEKQTYYLISYEQKGDLYSVVLNEVISPQNRDTWLVAKADVEISKV